MVENAGAGRREKTVSSFLKGTLILTLAGFVVKAIGSLNWIFLSRVLGGEGIGIYQMAFPLYLLALSISSAGIPVAISIITAEKIALQDYRGAQRVFSLSFMFLLVAGLALSLLLFVGAGWLTEQRIIRDPRTYYSIIALSPAIFLVTLLSSLRGYLQGWQLMTPTAVSQIVEQLFRVAAMLGFATLLLPRGLALAAGGASLGAAVGAAAALGVLTYYYFRLKRDNRLALAGETAGRPEKRHCHPQPDRCSGAACVAVGHHVAAGGQSGSFGCADAVGSGRIFGRAGDRTIRLFNRHGRAAG